MTVLDELLHLGNACGAANKHDLVDLVLLETRILQHLLHGAKSVLEEIVVQLLPHDSTPHSLFKQTILAATSKRFSGTW